MTEIILNEDVAKVGLKNTVVKVSPGYAQFLIKNGKARLSTDKERVAAEKLSREREEKEKRLESDIKEMLRKLPNVTLFSKSNEKGHLFEGVSVAKIMEALKKETGMDIPEKFIQIKTPIKEVGEHTVKISLNDWEGELTVVIKPSE